MKKIVFVNQASGYLTIDIVNAFADKYDKVDLISSSVRVQDIPLRDKVKITSTIKHSRKSNFSRLMRWLLSSIHVFFLLLTKYRSYEVFYISVPPMAYLCSLIVPNRFSILIYDIYPDVLKLFGVSESNFIYKWWAKANLKLFKKAHRIYTISDGMSRLLESYVQKKKIHVIQNWTGLTNLEPITKEQNTFIHDHELQGKFIVQYSGNISPTHNIEVLVDIAEKCQSYENVLFLIIGRGQLLPRIKEKVAELNLDNCKFLPFQPDNVLKYSLASADLGVVVLGKETSNISIPSKIYNIQAVGTPLMGISAHGSELEKHIIKYSNGRNFEHDQVEEIAQFIGDLSSNPSAHKELKQKALDSSQHFTYKNAEQFFQQY